MSYTLRITTLLHHLGSFVATITHSDTVEGTLTLQSLASTSGSDFATYGGWEIIYLRLGFLICK